MAVIKNNRAIAALLFLLALALRLAAPGVSPPGFNDDELSNALVINQLVREGDIRLYYDNASGHEGLYHILSAPLLPLFGANHVGIRGLSILLGALSVALLYLLTARMWGRRAALIAALGLAFSYWSLVYSRVGQRHISLPAFALLAFYCWWRGMESETASRRWFAASGAALGVGFYTYFASRGVPLILIAFAGYLALFHRERFRQRWRGMALALAIAAVLAVPLLATLQQNPAAEARVTELAAPLTALREGDSSMLWDYMLTTVGMFSFTGDDEALYNIPHRPVFGLGAVFFYIGLIAAVWRWREPRCVFALLWLAAGLAPGVMAVPAASLGHTILAQPAAYIFPALGILALAEKARQPRRAITYLMLLAGLYLGLEGARSLRDYFVVRPQDGFVRVLFHHDFIELAHYLDEHPEIKDIVIGAQIAERWNQEAFKLALVRDDVRARWFDPRESEVLLTDCPESPEDRRYHTALPHYFFALAEDTPEFQNDAFMLLSMPRESVPDATAVFENGLALDNFTLHDTQTDSVRVTGTWRVVAPPADHLPPRPLYSKPPAPGEPTTARLESFLHVLPPHGETPVYATGGLGVDPYTLFPCDVFAMDFALPVENLKPGVYRVAVGLFDPWTGARYLTKDGHDMVVIGELEVH